MCTFLDTTKKLRILSTWKGRAAQAEELINFFKSCHSSSIPSFRETDCRMHSCLSGQKFIFRINSAEKESYTTMKHCNSRLHYIIKFNYKKALGLQTTRFYKAIID